MPQRGARIYLMTLLGTSIGFLLVAVIWTGALAGAWILFLAACCNKPKA